MIKSKFRQRQPHDERRSAGPSDPRSVDRAHGPAAAASKRRAHRRARRPAAVDPRLRLRRRGREGGGDDSDPLPHRLDHQDLHRARDPAAARGPQPQARRPRARPRRHHHRDPRAQRRRARRHPARIAHPHLGPGARPAGHLVDRAQLSGAVSRQFQRRLSVGHRMEVFQHRLRAARRSGRGGERRNVGAARRAAHPRSAEDGGHRGDAPARRGAARDRLCAADAGRAAHAGGAHRLRRGESGGEPRLDDRGHEPLSRIPPNRRRRPARREGPARNASSAVALR